MLVAFFFSMKGNCTATDTLTVIASGFFSGYYINGNVTEYGACGPVPSIHVAIIDSLTCEPLNNCNINFGQANIFTDPDGNCITDVNSIYTCRARPETFFIYRAQNTTSIQSMAHLLDSIDEGHIIIAYSVFPAMYSTMDTSFRNVFQRLGSTLIPTMSDTVPFIFVCRKGDSGSVHEVIGSTSGDSISISMTYQCGPTSIVDINANSFNLYPNPVDDILHIDFNKIDFKTGEIKIYDAFGNLVSEKSKIEGDIEINTEGFPAGIYFIRFESTNYFSSVKFIKEE